MARFSRVALACGLAAACWPLSPALAAEPASAPAAPPAAAPAPTAAKDAPAAPAPVAPPAAEPVSPFRSLDLFARILQFVESNYVEPVAMGKLVEGAIKGMMQTLDPHSAFLSPEVYREMRIETSGEFGGLGIEVAMRDGFLTVISPMEGTPASRAGVRAGDRILSIDGKQTRGQRLVDALRGMRGPRGSKVKLVMQRPPSPKPFELELVRDRIRIRSARGYLLEPRFGYLKLSRFQEHSDRELRRALRQVEKENGGPLAGLILDLRNNPGGLLDQAVRVADLFLPSGLIVTTRGRGLKQEEKAFARDKGKGFARFPMVVLVNGGTASASEIVAGALQDHQRAVVLGTQTFGKGSVQTVMEMADADGHKVGLKLTIARYYTPKGRSIQERGISPDIVVEEGRAAKVRPPAVRREKDLDRHFRGEPPREAAARVVPPPVQRLLGDQQVKTALDHLKAYRILRALGGQAPHRI